MALYRTGTASMDAQGVITGVGTKWREPLSLIRTGATIVFLTTPLTLAVISDIVSDTEMKAIQTNGAVVPDGSNYVILLNDSLTVDGMAQDVAETLRYYQSKETEIADALEFFRDFDLQGLKDLVARIEQAAKDTDQAKLDAQAAQAGAEAAQQATNQIKQETQQIKDSAVTDIDAIKNEALDARDAAEEAQFAAEESKAGADTAKAGAETARDQAEQWAKSVSPENLLHKDQNPADVSDRQGARNILDVPADIETFLIANNFSEIADRAAAWLNMRPIGATPLGGDPVSDYDATTKRWVRNYVKGGGVGPTMNGVQNSGIGEKILWDSRAFIPRWAVPLDGQLLNRTDWPELWAHAQMHTPIDDADWLSSAFKRGKWSNGDGRTTFRAPDLNGVQSGSIPGLFGRGDSRGCYCPDWLFLFYQFVLFGHGNPENYYCKPRDNEADCVCCVSHIKCRSCESKHAPYYLRRCSFQWNACSHRRIALALHVPSGLCLLHARPRCSIARCRSECGKSKLLRRCCVSSSFPQFVSLNALSLIGSMEFQQKCYFSDRMTKGYSVQFPGHQQVIPIIPDSMEKREKSRCCLRFTQSCSFVSVFVRFSAFSIDVDCFV
ncbi:tail fiber [Vibrio phage Vc1]|uniref:Tail fiber n=1 Tax=Vibrio phage Vc1 TaxID=1480731 RepID=A0A9X9SEX0_9CAUD|nr:tail fiber [Vibrio virus 2019VC1]